MSFSKTFILLLSLILSVPALCADSTITLAGQEEFTRHYCMECHNSEDWAGSIAFDLLPASGIHNDKEIWEKVILKLRVGMMPPPQAELFPSTELRDNFIGALEESLDALSRANPEPGPTLVRRLNRAEYQNAIRDLLDLTVDASSLLPPDDPAYGFDNNAEALGTSPVLVEQYLSAAGKIAALAVGDPETGPSGETFRIRQDASQNTHIHGMPVGTVGGGMFHTVLPLDGEYRLDVRFFKSNLGAMKGLEFPHDLEITVDGERVHLATIGGPDDFTALMQNITAGADAVEARSSTVLTLPAGPHDIGVGFIYQGAVQNSQRLQAFIRSSQDLLDATGHPHIETFTITGPYKATGSGDTPSRRRIFSCQPGSQSSLANAEQQQCAHDILSRLARQAYRGTDTARDIDTLMDFYLRGSESGGFESGIQMAIERLLASPKFTFRIEQEQENMTPGTVYPISEHDLASRLSFFLWSSIPDEELLVLADNGSLSDPEVIEQQAQRMLADAKAQALVENFAGQWLYLRNLRGMVPNSSSFPDFDDNLRQGLLTETELFFKSIVEEDRNVMDLMTADYTFLNERVAQHYDIDNVYGSHFRKVMLEDEARWGLLGKGSVLMISSHSDGTSPVVRGKWVLDNLLGAPPPAPPPDVPTLPEVETSDGKILTMRERLEMHRADPACAGCHTLMDPIGFSMENFNAVGAWRDYVGGSNSARINAHGRILGGFDVEGPVELRHFLTKEPEVFISMLTEKLMIYALGRGSVATDKPVIRKIVREAEDGRFSALISGIVRSVPFQMRVNTE